MRRILCAIDHSEPSLRAASLAMDLATRCGAAQLVLLNVARLPDAEQQDLTAYLRDEHEAESPLVLVTEAARGDLRRVVDRLGAHGVPIECAVRVGNAAPEIIAAAREHDSDLIVVGHRGRSRLARALIGSVAKTVVETAHCPVLVVR